MLIKSLEWTGAKGPPLDFECEDQCFCFCYHSHCWELSNTAGSENFFCQEPGSKYVRLCGRSDSFATAQLCHSRAKAALADALTNEWTWVSQVLFTKAGNGSELTCGLSMAAVECRIGPLLLVRDSSFAVATGRWPLLLFCLPNCMRVHLVGTI